MNIEEFSRVLSSFADEPTDVDVRLGRVVAQIRDDIIDVTIKYSEDQERRLLVCENGEEYPARSWLLNRVARLPQLADRIISTNSASAESEAKSPFIIPSGTLSPDISDNAPQEELVPVENAVNVLLEKAERPLPGATSVMYVTSDAGEGKTTIINRAASEQAILYKRKAASALIIPIPLSGRAFLTFDDAVIAALVNKLRFNYLYFDAFIQLVRMGALVPAFDGYEEMLVEGSRGEAISALGNLVQNLGSSGTIFVAARKAFFEYLSFKTQARLLDAIGDRSASFSRLEISRWDKTRFCEYGRLRNVADPEEIYGTVSSRLSASHPLLTRAVLVRRLFDVASNMEGRDRLTELLGSNPHDYFYTFVDAIVKREANEKWLSNVAGDVMEPLLTVDEHHDILALIAQEMWQSSTNSLRYDVVDVLVDIFSESKKKSASVMRQIKERIKQHSLLISDSSRSRTIMFDHEDFQNFYLGESVGRLLADDSKTEMQSFISIALIPSATIEQAVQYLIRHNVIPKRVLRTLMEINSEELSFSYCKENCGALVVRILEYAAADDIDGGELFGLYFPPGALDARNLEGITFENCQFMPTGITAGGLKNVYFKKCEFERIEVYEAEALSGCVFDDCRVDSLVRSEDESQIFDPDVIDRSLGRLGARVVGRDVASGQQAIAFDEDEKIKVLEKFLRIFMRSTSVDESVLKLRLGTQGAPMFFSELLPELLQYGVLEEGKWRGQGVQKRYKLTRPLMEIDKALEEAKGNYGTFITHMKNNP